MGPEGSQCVCRTPEMFSSTAFCDHLCSGAISSATNSCNEWPWALLRCAISTSMTADPAWESSFCHLQVDWVWHLRSLGRLEDVGEQRQFLARSEVKKRRRVKAGEGLWQSTRAPFLFPVGISNKFCLSSLTPAHFVPINCMGAVLSDLPWTVPVSIAVFKSWLLTAASCYHLLLLRLSHVNSHGLLSL